MEICVVFLSSKTLQEVLLVYDDHKSGLLASLSTTVYNIVAPNFSFFSYYFVIYHCDYAK